MAGVSYSLDPVKHIAWKTRDGRGHQRSCWTRFKQTLKSRPRPKVQIQGRGRRPAGAGGRVRIRAASGQHSEETLAPTQLEGVLAEGHRNTTTIAAGAIGNEQPITIVSEEWRSPDLGVLVLTDHKDPRSGESSYQLLNIVRGEPDASLFQVPADYTIKETGVRRLEQQQEQ